MSTSRSSAASGSTGGNPTVASRPPLQGGRVVSRIVNSATVKTPPTPSFHSKPQSSSPPAPTHRIPAAPSTSDCSELYTVNQTFSGHAQYRFRSFRVVGEAGTGGGSGELSLWIWDAISQRHQKIRQDQLHRWADETSKRSAKAQRGFCKPLAIPGRPKTSTTTFIKVLTGDIRSFATATVKVDVDHAVSWVTWWTSCCAVTLGHLWIRGYCSIDCRSNPHPSFDLIHNLQTSSTAFAGYADDLQLFVRPDHIGTDRGTFSMNRIELGNPWTTLPGTLFPSACNGSQSQQSVTLNAWVVAHPSGHADAILTSVSGVDVPPTRVYSALTGEQIFDFIYCGATKLSAEVYHHVVDYQERYWTLLHGSPSVGASGLGYFLAPLKPAPFSAYSADLEGQIDTDLISRLVSLDITYSPPVAVGDTVVIRAPSDDQNGVRLANITDVDAGSDGCRADIEPIPDKRHVSLFPHLIGGATNLGSSMSIEVEKLAPLPVTKAFASAAAYIPSAVVALEIHIMGAAVHSQVFNGLLNDVDICSVLHVLTDTDSSHSAYTNLETGRNRTDGEVLEYVGDSVLEVLAATLAFLTQPNNFNQHVRGTVKNVNLASAMKRTGLQRFTWPILKEREEMQPVATSDRFTLVSDGKRSGDQAEGIIGLAVSADGRSMDKILQVCQAIGIVTDPNLRWSHIISGFNINALVSSLQDPVQVSWALRLECAWRMGTTFPSIRYLDLLYSFELPNAHTWNLRTLGDDILRYLMTDHLRQLPEGLSPPIIRLMREWWSSDGAVAIMAEQSFLGLDASVLPSRAVHLVSRLRLRIRQAWTERSTERDTAVPFWLWMADSQCLTDAADACRLLLALLYLGDRVSLRQCEDWFRRFALPIFSQGIGTWANIRPATKRSASTAASAAAGRVCRDVEQRTRRTSQYDHVTGRQLHRTIISFHRHQIADRSHVCAARADELAFQDSIAFWTNNPHAATVASRCDCPAIQPSSTAMFIEKNGIPVQYPAQPSSEEAFLGLVPQADGGWA